MNTTEYKIFDPTFPRKVPYQRKVGKIVEKTWWIPIILCIALLLVPQAYKPIVGTILIPFLFLQVLGMVLNLFSEPHQNIPTIGTITFSEDYLSIDYLDFNKRYSELNFFDCSIAEHEGEWKNLSPLKWEQMIGKAYVSYGGGNYFFINDLKLEFHLKNKSRREFLENELLPWIKRKLPPTKPSM